jgi:hypothetical protein
MLPFYWKMENGRPGNFPQSFYSLLVVQMELRHFPFVDKKQTEVIRLQTD